MKIRTVIWFVTITALCCWLSVSVYTEYMLAVAPDVEPIHQDGIYMIFSIGGDNVKVIPLSTNMQRRNDTIFVPDFKWVIALNPPVQSDSTQQVLLFSGGTAQ